MVMTRKFESEHLLVSFVGDLLKPHNQSHAGLMAKGASGTFVLKVVNTALGLGMAVFLARLLGVRGYGIYAYAISWITLLGVFARLGMDQTIGRYVATYHQEGDWARIHGLLRFSFAAVAGSAMVCLLAAGAVAWSAYRDVAEMRNALCVASLILPISALMVPCSATLAGLQKVVSAQIPLLLVQPVGFILLVGGAWILFPDSLSPINVLILYLLVTCLSLAVAAWLLRRAMASRNDTSTSTVRPVYEVRDWLKSALPLMLMGGMFLANSNTDILMLGAMVGPEAAAVYKAATRGAELVVFSLSIIIAPLAPLIAKLHTSGDLERLQKGITKSAKVVFIFSLLTAILLIVFGKYFLFLFGYEFTQGRIALNILIAGQLVNSATGISGAILVMCGLEKKAALGLLFGVTANIVLNCVLIPIWGINGAAIATCLSTILWTSLLTVFVMKDLKLNPTFIVFK